MSRLLTNRRASILTTMLGLSTSLIPLNVHAEPLQYFSDRNNSPDDNYKIPNDWLSCSNVADCALIKGVCGTWTPVNKKHEKNLENWARERNSTVSCIHFSGAEPEILCRNSLCDYMLIDSE